MPNSIPTTCIYCKRTNVAFNREHVIPDAFGSYGGATMVLLDTVCANCNSRLGAELDQILCRDSYEALIRQQHLIQREPSGERFQARRFQISLPDRDEFEILRGARLTINWDTHSHQLLDQVIVRDQTGRIHTFLENELVGADDSLFQNLPPGGLRIVGTDTATVSRLIQAVRTRGARVGNQESLPPPSSLRGGEISTIIEGRIDDRTWRAIAKIAFNYLAHREGTSYVLNEKFDRIRSFILGTLSDRAMVRLMNQAILTDETYHWRTFEGHLVAYQTEDRNLRGKVSLYNSITYEVMLCPDLGLYYPLKSGHAFDPVEERIATLTGLPLEILRPAAPMSFLHFFPLD